MKISIMGASGSLGSSTAFNIAVQGLAEEIVLLGRRQNFLLHHAGDITTAALEKDVLVRAGSDEDLKGSDIVIMCAGAPEGAHFSSRRDLLPDNILIVNAAAEKIRHYCPGAIVITVTAPVEAMNYAMQLGTGIDRLRVLGYTLNDSLRFRNAIAMTLRVKPSRVGAVVIGEHGETQVLLFTSILLDKKPYVLDNNTARVIEQKVLDYLPWHISLKTGLTSGWTCAAGITSMVRAIRDNSEALMPCSVVLNGEYNCSNISMTVPAILGKNGVTRIVEMEISGAEKEKLTKSIQTISPYTQFVEQNSAIKN
jgi:malate dehydrogenase